MSYTRPSAKMPGSTPDVPKGQYVVYCAKATLAKGKSEPYNPQIVCDMEIRAPDTVTFNGHTLRTAGRIGRMYLAFTEKNLENIINVFAALGIELPPPADSLEADLEAMRQALHAALPGLSWLHSLQSERQQLKDANDQPILDNAGAPIYGRDRLDFHMFNILPNTYTRVDTGAPY